MKPQTIKTTKVDQQEKDHDARGDSDASITLAPKPGKPRTAREVTPETRPSPEEQRLYDKCCARIEKGPRTPAAIGEALWQVQSGRLYREQADTMVEFLDKRVGIEAAEGLSILADWERSVGGPVSADTGAVRRNRCAPTPPEHPTAPAPEPAPAGEAKAGQGAATPAPATSATEAPATLPSVPTAARSQQGLGEHSTGKPKDALPTPNEAARNQQSVSTRTEDDAIENLSAAVRSKKTQTPAVGDGAQPKAKEMVTSAIDHPGSEPRPNKAASTPNVATQVPGASGTHQPEGSLPPSAGAQPANGASVVDLPLAAITVDPTIQCRAALNEKTVVEYSERMAAGDKFPPLLAFRVDGQILLAAGFHRHPAALKAGLKSFPVEVRDGTRKDAIRYAIEDNTSHGLPRTNKDKRRAVEMALRELPELGAHLISGLCRVSQPFVSKVRRQLKTVFSSKPTLGRDGKRRKPPKKKVSSDAAQPSASSCSDTATTAQEQDAGATTSESHEATGDNGSSSQEKATHAQSAGGSKDHEARQRESKYDLDKAYVRISDLLLKEFNQCPQDKLGELVDRLKRLMDRQWEPSKNKC